MAKITKTLVGESLVGDGNEVAHIDLIIGPRGSPAEAAFAMTLTNQKEGVNGLLAPVNDDRSLADCALRLLADPALAGALARAAHASTDRFSWDAVRPAWLSAYRGLSRHAAPAASAVHQA